MTKKKKEIGVCCICGKFEELSFEHVPPKAAYNKDTIIEYQWEDVIQKRKVKPKIVQGGAGASTLCQSCNNDTGSWYGGEYVKWARTCRDVLLTWNQKKVIEGVVTINNVYPLRFLKQVVACFMSVTGNRSNGKFLKKHPEFTNFLLDKQNNELPYNFRFFLSLSMSNEIRRLPFAVMGKVDNKLNVLNTMEFSEIIHLPLHLTMTLDDKVIESSTEITVFKNFDYDEKTNIEIPMYVTISQVPIPKFP